MYIYVRHTYIYVDLLVLKLKVSPLSYSKVLKKINSLRYLSIFSME